MKIHKSIIIAVMLVLVSVPAYSANLDTTNTSGKLSMSFTVPYRLTMTFTLNPFATVKTAPAAVANLEYDGNAQALVTAGEAEGGTMLYALGTSEAASEDYDVSIPTAIDEGIYYVWYKVSGDSTHRDSESAEVVSVNMTLTTYTITYDMNGGGDNPAGNPSGYTVKSGDIRLSAPVSSRAGYEFSGWLLSGDESFALSTDVTVQTSRRGNYTYIAQWKALTYSLTYELNGGSVSPDNPASYDVETETFTLNNPVKTGYIFGGWTGTSLDAAAATVTVAKGSTGNRAYSALWSAEVYTISYDLDGGEVSPDNPAGYTIESDDFTLTQPTREGYSFAGWTGTDLTEASTDVTIPAGSTGNREYSAVWSAEVYTISYDLQGGEVSPDNPAAYTIESDDFTLTQPTKDGYSFAGWIGTDLTEASTDVTIPAGSTGNREYSAVWSIDVYTISYDLDGGEVSPDNPAGYTIESSDFTLTQPTREGYSFAGWTGTDLTGASTDVTISAGQQETVSILRRGQLRNTR